MANSTVQQMVDEAQAYRWVVLALVVLTWITTFFIRLTWPPSSIDGALRGEGQISACKVQGGGCETLHSRLQTVS